MTKKLKKKLKRGSPNTYNVWHPMIWNLELRSLYNTKIEWCKPGFGIVTDLGVKIVEVAERGWK
jgi:hypothetical protein